MATMTMRVLTRLAMTLAAAVGWLITIGTSPAAASMCLSHVEKGYPPSEESEEEATRASDVVLVGTVESVAGYVEWVPDRGTLAKVVVEEVRKGPARPETVVVDGGPFSTASRTFKPGERYLFFLSLPNEPGDPFEESSCTYTRGLQTAGSRPAQWWPAAGLPGVPMVVGVFLLGRQRRRRQRRVRRPAEPEWRSPLTIAKPDSDDDPPSSP